MDLPDPGIELGSPALQADSLPAELSEKPHLVPTNFTPGRSLGLSYQVTPKSFLRASSQALERHSPFTCPWFQASVHVHLPPDSELVAGRDHSIIFSITPDLQGTWSKVSDCSVMKWGDLGNPFLILTS